MITAYRHDGLDTTTVEPGKKHAAAVRALSNKWAKILAAVLRARTPYDEDLHVARLLEREVAWAGDLPEKVAA